MAALVVLALQFLTLWAAVLVNTAKGVWRGTVFPPHAPPGASGTRETA